MTIQQSPEYVSAASDQTTAPIKYRLGQHVKVNFNCKTTHPFVERVITYIGRISQLPNEPLAEHGHSDAPHLVAPFAQNEFYLIKTDQRSIVERVITRNGDLKSTEYSTDVADLCFRAGTPYIEIEPIVPAPR